MGCRKVMPAGTTSMEVSLGGTYQFGKKSQSFGDDAFLKSSDDFRVLRLSCWSLDHVSCIEVIFMVNGVKKTRSYGPYSGMLTSLRLSTLDLEEDEMITRVQTSSGDVIDWVKFTTSKGRELRSGGYGGSPNACVHTSSDLRFAGFRGFYTGVKTQRATITNLSVLLLPTSSHASVYATNVTAAELVSSQVEALLFSEEYADVVFECSGGQERIFAHKNLIATFSPVMKAALTGPWSENSDKNLSVIKVPQSAAAIRGLLTYAYTKRAKFDDNFPIDLLELAAQHQCPEFTSLCECAAVRSLTVSTVCGIVVSAIQNDMRGLKATCIDFIRDNALAMLISSEWLALKSVQREVWDELRLALGGAVSGKKRSLDDISGSSSSSSSSPGVKILKIGDSSNDTLEALRLRLDGNALTCSNGWFLTARRGGALRFEAPDDKVSAIWRVEVHGDRLAFRGHHGMYLSAANNGTWVLSSQAGSQEKHQVVEYADGSISIRGPRAYLCAPLQSIAGGSPISGETAVRFSVVHFSNVDVESSDGSDSGSDSSDDD